MNTREIALALESTRLGPDVTIPAIEDLVDEAIDLGVPRVCVPSSHVWTARAIADGQVDVVATANFPHGQNDIDAVAAEIALSADRGAAEIDVVAPLHVQHAGAWSSYGDAISEWVRVAPEGGLKIILETAAFPAAVTREAARVALDAGAGWLKTSTGMHAAGGATEAVTRMLVDLAGDEAGVKASGGIRRRVDAIRFLDLGVQRIGTSRARAILTAEE